MLLALVVSYHLIVAAVLEREVERSGAHRKRADASHQNLLTGYYVSYKCNSILYNGIAVSHKISMNTARELDDALLIRIDSGEQQPLQLAGLLSCTQTRVISNRVVRDKTKMD